MLVSLTIMLIMTHRMLMLLIMMLMMLIIMLQKALKETLKNHVFEKYTRKKQLCIKKTL